MTDSGGPGLHDAFMLDLFRTEVESQVLTMSAGLLALERQPQATEGLETLMRAAHSIKGAARIVQSEAVVEMAHAMEDCFVAAQEGKIVLAGDPIDVLLHGVDLLVLLTEVGATEVAPWLSEHEAEIRQATAALQAILYPQAVVSVAKPPGPGRSPALPELPPEPRAAETTLVSPRSAPRGSVDQDRVLRVTAENFSRLMGLAGESLVESRWLQPFAHSLLRLKRSHVELSEALDRLQESLAELDLNERTKGHVNEAQLKAKECRQVLSDRLAELEMLVGRSANLSDRLYREAVAARMRPFADGVQGFPRMVRDLAKTLGKQVKLEIMGKSTAVDRDVLEKLEAPLNHLLRNALDHGIEAPKERLAAGKPVEGTVRLEARHRAGLLSITVSDDGRGVDLGHLRQTVVRKNLVTAETAEALTESELMEFLFLPGFSTAAAITEVSGRGVGLDVVRSLVQEVGGVVQAVSQAGRGTSFHLQLPLTLSVIRALLVEILAEPYAFPLTRIDRILTVPKADVQILENRQYFVMDNHNVGLVPAHQVLELPEPDAPLEELPVIVVRDRVNRYGLVVDAFLGESDLVVQPLDPRLGKVPDISAAALVKDGSPVLIVDVEDIVRSIDNLLSGGRLRKVSQSGDGIDLQTRKRILVVDDSVTVREAQRNLLENNGYKVDVAVDGMEGWNAVRLGHYDLVITDVDMPRLNGLEFVSLIKKDAQLKSLPVMMVSYKDRQEDRIRGLEAGASCYLTKSSLHDETLLAAVIDLIGKSDV